MKALAAALFLCAMTAATPSSTQTAPTEYGPPISARAALELINRGMERSAERNLTMALAVVEPSGELVAFVRMDNAPYASSQLAQQKARTSARLRLSTAELEARVMAGRTVLLSSDEVFAIGGGVPIVRNGRVVGAVGISGGAAAQDTEIAMAIVADP